MNITVAGTGYVGLSNAILLVQNHHVIAVDIMPEKVEMISNKNLLFSIKRLISIFGNKGLGFNSIIGC